MKLSIITINYNNCAGLRKTMQSVFEQSFTDYEYLIFDGGSTDGSQVCIEQNADKLIFWVSENDNGVYDAMNKGIRIASGEYLMFLNSGDYLLHKNVFLNFIQYAEKRNADIYYGNVQLENENRVVNSLTYPPVLTLKFWEQSTINHQASFLRATLFNELGLYDMRYCLAADYAFFLKSYFTGKYFEFIDDYWVHYQLIGISSVNREEYKQQMKAAWKSIIPDYLDTMYREHTEHSLLMQHSMMRWAKNLNDQYIRFKSVLRK